MEETDDVTEIPNDQNEDKTESSVFLLEDSKEMNKYLDQIEKWSIKSRKIVVKRLLEQIVGNKHVPEEDLEIFRNVLQDHVNMEKVSPSVSEVRDRFSEDDIDEDHGGEVEDSPISGVDHFIDNGKFNQKNQINNKKDKSNEEVRSSWSSSEEALASCEGAVFNIALNGATACHENATFDQMRQSMSNMSYLTDTAGQSLIILFNSYFSGKKICKINPGGPFMAP